MCRISNQHSSSILPFDKNNFLERHHSKFCPFIPQIFHGSSFGSMELRRNLFHDGRSLTGTKTWDMRIGIFLVVLQDQKPKDSVFCACDDDVGASFVFYDLTCSSSQIRIFEIIDRYSKRAIILRRYSSNIFVSWMRHI